MKRNMEYGDFISFLERKSYIKTRMNAVSYLVGYFGCLSEEHWKYVQQAYADGFLKY